MRTQSTNNRRMRELIVSIREQLDELTFLAGLGKGVVSCSEAANYLGVDPHTISRMIKDGRLHKVSNGVRTGIELAELENCKKN